MIASPAEDTAPTDSNKIEDVGNSSSMQCTASSRRSPSDAMVTEVVAPAQTIVLSLSDVFRSDVELSRNRPRVVNEMDRSPSITSHTLTLTPTIMVGALRFGRSPQLGDGVGPRGALR